MCVAVLQASAADAGAVAMTVAKCVLQMCLQGCLQRVRLLVDSVLYCFQKTICLWFRVSLGNAGFPCCQFMVPGSFLQVSLFSLWFRVTFIKFLCDLRRFVVPSHFW